MQLEKCCFCHTIPIVVKAKYAEASHTPMGDFAEVEIGCPGCNFTFIRKFNKRDYPFLSLETFPVLYAKMWNKSHKRINEMNDRLASLEKMVEKLEGFTQAADDVAQEIIDDAFSTLEKKYEDGGRNTLGVNWVPGAIFRTSARNLVLATNVDHFDGEAYYIGLCYDEKRDDHPHFRRWDGNGEFIGPAIDDFNESIVHLELKPTHNAFKKKEYIHE